MAEHWHEDARFDEGCEGCQADVLAGQPAPPQRAPLELSARDTLLEFGQWLGNKPTRVTDLSEAIDDDDPLAFVALVDRFLAPSGVGGPDG